MAKDLWGHALEQDLAAGAPLATRMRPQSLAALRVSKWDRVTRATTSARVVLPLPGGP